MRPMQNAVPRRCSRIGERGSFSSAVPRRSAAAGFTIVELIVVMAIVGVLVALAIPAVTRAREAAKRTQCANNLRNIALALSLFEETHGRLPASGNFFDADGNFGIHHSWAVSILPWIEQGNLADKWDLDKPITDPANQPLTQMHIPTYVCPVDLSRSKPPKGDLSYVVNGGVGYTIRYQGVGDCPVDANRALLDLSGDGSACIGTEADDEDRKFFKQLGLFFLENWNEGGTVRHHRLSDVADGASQTFMVAENVRAGYDPAPGSTGYASSDPARCAFYIGSPCLNGDCGSGIDYSLCNAGTSRINSGLWAAEGRSAVPNSFHTGGVQMAYADTHIVFLSEAIDGAVYAALASPQGLRLDETPLRQLVPGDAP